LKLEHTDLNIYIIEEKDLDKIQDPELIVEIPRDRLATEEYIKAVAYHYLTTTHLRETWIRDDALRFLALYYRESQIHRLPRPGEDKILIVLAREGVDTIKPGRGLEGVAELAAFRAEIEKTRTRAV